MTLKLVKISLLSLLSYLFICLFAPNFVFSADAREDAFRASCSYTIQETACTGTQISYLSLGIAGNLYCCDNSQVGTSANQQTNTNNSTTNPNSGETSTDPRENAFIQKCYNELSGNYLRRTVAALDTNPCASGDQQVGSLSLGYTNIFCCQGTNGLNDEDGDSSLPEELRLNISVNHLKNSSLKEMNPLRGSVLGDATPGQIINRALSTVVFPIAGIGMLILILMGGFQIITASTSGKQNYLDVGKRQVTAAIIGFILLFLVYWIWRAITLATGLSL